ncbi:hypothetical protein DMB95_07385 [Campylobacter sp. MIT 12-8780]|uniref:hypothetical protein n=1 Tax=unclassified Campylobacter TaxID=2593542 RepID=UPI00115E4F16|nr:MULTISPECIES: hypothetical protein [unclassified Campylobacter]NDJ27904.1 hypothetical protein [Campylobacter sp. MIT 19-121]TQR40646.1 hypothetical protein DMB95_07385 [Campylobacter sp. MIT 12-8780]
MVFQTLFDSLFEFLLYYLSFLALVSLIGMKFAKKHEQLEQNPSQKSSLKKLYKNCPCRKAVQNGVMSSACIYSAAAGFMLSLTNIALISNYTLRNFIVLALSLLCFYLGWVLKK